MTGILTHQFSRVVNAQAGFPVFPTMIEANSVTKNEDRFSGDAAPAVSHVSPATATHGLAAQPGGRLPRIDRRGRTTRSHERRHIRSSLAAARLTDEDKQAIMALARDKNIARRIVKSIAPSIHGHENIKEALALAMFGGQRKVREESIPSLFRCQRHGTPRMGISAAPSAVHGPLLAQNSQARLSACCPLKAPPHIPLWRSPSLSLLCHHTISITLHDPLPPHPPCPAGRRQAQAAGRHQRPPPRGSGSGQVAVSQVRRESRAEGRFHHREGRLRGGTHGSRAQGPDHKGVCAGRGSACSGGQRGLPDRRGVCGCLWMPS